ncbi:nucleolar pre-ribosomal-associated protein 1 [Adelges cooleyi]|uniref:nucleolar pre-ribosomal-associated protein 1 n=1 Tax=Adelges cooleyi TaxID=133065 RepID=UPI00217FFB61|nr:nucleolar pre-ribosomal-associated protein 1 [Adelges cooleyi]XP_050435681.1 nucleolar pre-ribosomal-associated protein 1 [Adelges cooleyi]XP_050435682.1 nucleolar pre-ribosomal-associated protein 1 [Adelges cooleyi]
MEEYKTTLKTAIENKQFIDNKLFSKLAEYLENNKKAHKYDSLLLEYLKVFPQQVVRLPSDLFLHLTSNKDEPLHPLYLFVAARHNYLNQQIFYNLNLNSLPTDKWAYLMSAFYQRLEMIMYDPTFTKRAKEKIDTYSMLINSPNWFTDNEEFFLGLHLIEYDEEECHEVFEKLKNNWSDFKINKASVSFVDLIASKCDKEIEFIQFLISALFSLPPDSTDVVWLSDKIIKTLKMLEDNSSIFISDWDAITKKALKCLLDEDAKYDFVKVLRKLLDKTSIDKLIASNTLSLLTGHSQFCNVMLNRSANQSQKEEVLKLLEVLVNKQPSLMTLSHVPFFLCSYNASLSVTDQLLLRLLFSYEENSIPVSNYRPYLWGSFAVDHYQVKNHLESKTLYDFPSTTEVISYVPYKRVKETITYFPIERVLHIKNQKILHCKNTKDPSNMLDPAFFLPMISSLLGTEAPLSIEKFTKNGCLSMVLACLGSCDDAIRLAAYHVLTRLRSHLFCRRAENLLWDHFISWAAHGIHDLHLKPPPQLPMIQALFLARMVLAMANYEKSIDVTCYKILLARPAARLNNVPEMKTFMNAISIENDKTRHVRWIFKVIRDGTRSNADWQILKNMDLLNMFLVTLSCGSSKPKMLIMKIMEAAFLVQPATNGGTGPWALSLMMAISKLQVKLSTEEVIQMFSCLNALSASSSISTATVDFLLFMFLEYGNVLDVAVAGFATLANIASKYMESFQLLTNQNLLDVLDCGESSTALTPDEIQKCRCVLEHGVNGIQIDNNENTYLYLPTLLKYLKTS